MKYLREPKTMAQQERPKPERAPVVSTRVPKALFEDLHCAARQGDIRVGRLVACVLEDYVGWLKTKRRRG
jgi:hypothetical protein